jgi:hypothetical protein
VARDGGAVEEEPLAGLVVEGRFMDLDFDGVWCALVSVLIHSALVSTYRMDV